MSEFPKYDYIIAGAGCAGLSLAMHLLHSNKFSNKRILIVDKVKEKSNDRTWCFWQIEPSLFDGIVFKTWSKLWFHGENFSTKMDISPYQYKMIRGIDFYEYCFKKIGQNKKVDILFEQVESVFSNERAGVVVNGESIFADYVFNSILFEKPKLQVDDLWLLQHFKGWIIETEVNEFDRYVGTLMDFRIDQSAGTAFCYVLPLSSRRALIEHTLFSDRLLEEQEYNDGLKSYISKTLQISSYKILEEEFGIIPMTGYKFPSHQGNVINIGTAGGQTKGSTGYTFQFIQKHSRAIVDALINAKTPIIKPASRRFDFYDRVLLKVLSSGMASGKEVFTNLFKKNRIDKVFKFLDNETLLAEEVKIIASLPSMPFLKAGTPQFSKLVSRLIRPLKGE